MFEAIGRVLDKLLKFIGHAIGCVVSLVLLIVLLCWSFPWGLIILLIWGYAVSDE